MFARGPIIRDRELVLMPLRYRDRDLWHQVRRINREWLNPWEATRPEIDSDGPLPNYAEMIRFQNKELKAGRSYSLGLWLTDGGNERFIGQVTLGGIVMGPTEVAILAIGLTNVLPAGATQLELLLPE